MSRELRTLLRRQWTHYCDTVEYIPWPQWNKERMNMAQTGEVVQELAKLRDKA